MIWRPACANRGPIRRRCPAMPAASTAKGSVSTFSIVMVMAKTVPASGPKTSAAIGNPRKPLFELPIPMARIQPSGADGRRITRTSAYPRTIVRIEAAA